MVEKPDIVLLSPSDETSATVVSFGGRNCTDNHPSDAPAAIVSDELDGKEMSATDGQAYQEFDSDDDFFSVAGEFTPSCSNSSSRQRSFEGSLQLQKTCDSRETFLQEPFLRNSIDEQGSALPAYKEVKLAEFFRDRHWKGEIASVESSPPIASVIKENGIRDLPRNGISRIPRQNLMINHKNRNSDLKSQNKEVATYCCMPSWSPRRGSKEKRKPRWARV